MAQRNQSDEKIILIEDQPYNESRTVWKLRKFTLTHFWQKFRESNGFNTREITK